jgi:hypothetical protein
MSCEKNAGKPILSLHINAWLLLWKKEAQKYLAASMIYKKNFPNRSIVL